MVEPVTHTIRAYSMPALIAFTEGNLTPEQLAAVQAKAPLIFDRVKRGDVQGNAPLEEMNQFYLAVEEVLGSVEATYQFAVKGSEEGVGKAALNSFLRLVIKFMPINVFARKCHDFYRRDVNFSTVTLESFDADARRFVLGMSGMEPFHYGAAAMIGVVTCMMKAMGHENTRIVEELHPPPAPQANDCYRLVITW